MSKKTNVNEADYAEMINNFFGKMINFVYNNYENKKQNELLGLEDSYEFNIDYNKYVFEIDRKLDLRVNGKLIQKNVWRKGKLLRAENRLKALALIDRNSSWIYNVDDLIINKVKYKKLSSFGYDDFMRDEIIETIEPLIKVLNS